ncbi:hypothetical protein [Citrobacter phage CVT22]|uniref:Uncharacterized protein n=1 Tax=Citrobacter phage CVT22 TaxID=1622234 RepID=A0A0R6BQ80_9CAUD|nr:hypothetical protein APL39_gp57 [Citrobacter phage CVT22]AJT60761.1 hypothetical protein [Citrobacter phage CVT22]
MYYESEADVNLRLKGSLVRKENVPMYVQEANSKDEVRVHNVHTGRKEDCLIADLDLTPVPLGYCVSDGDVLYVSRKPTRKYKQGLTTENSVAWDVMLQRHVKIPMADKGLCRTIMNDYPSVEEAFQECRKGKAIVPFHRSWAVANYKDELCVMHKGTVVGYVGDDVVVLMPEKYFLKESLEEALGV